MSDFDKLVEAIKQRGIQETAYENMKLNHIINELKKWLEEKIKKIKEQIEHFDIWHDVGTDINFLILNKQLYQEILNKLQELKGDVDDEQNLY